MKPAFDPYSTHQPALLSACFRTTGPILELGTGHYSTPLLREIALFQQRTHIALESDPDWFHHIQATYPDLNIQLVPDWTTHPILQNTQVWFGVVFIDHSPGEQRVRDIQRLADRAKILVLHDSEDPGYGYDAVYSLFQFRRDWKERIPYTTQLSKVIPL